MSSRDDVVVHGSSGDFVVAVNLCSLVSVVVVALRYSSGCEVVEAFTT